MKTMELDCKEKQQLRDWGYSERDIKQIVEACSTGSIFLMPDKRIDSNHARRILGGDEFLSGISRAAFHWTAMRIAGDNKVYFDFSNYFRS